KITPQGRSALARSTTEEPLEPIVVPALEGGLGFEAVLVAVDGRDGADSPAVPVGDQGVPGAKVAGDFDPVPGFGVPHVVDGDVIVLAPEERYGAERLPA